VMIAYDICDKDTGRVVAAYLSRDKAESHLAAIKSNGNYHIIVRQLREGLA